MMIAKDLNEFVTKMEEAERKALNNDLGQEMTNKLLKMKLADNPNMTPEEWKQTKSEFMTFIFYQALKEFPDLMDEFSEHVYNKLRKEG